MNNRFKWSIVVTSTLVVVGLLVGAIHGRTVSSTSNDDVYGHLRVYSEVLQRIKLEYVEEPDMKNVTLGAINGLLESVDPFASYLNADQYKQYVKNKDTAKADVGLILAKRFGYVSVIDALPNSPAIKANISSGDLIETINGVATRDMPLAYAEQLLAGDAGSTVEVTVLRMRNPEPQKVTLSRLAISYPDVTAKMMPNDVGYLQVESLAGNRPGEVKAKLQGLMKQGAKYVILDLRHCATGDPQSGVPVANLFVDKGEIAYSKGQKFDKTDFNAKPEADVWNGPLVVITNRATAGGAEVAAAGLMELKRAQVVGERTYGDAGIRKTVQMEDGAAVILSVAKYYSPNGKAIQDTQVVPTVQLAENDNSPELDQDGNPIPGTEPKTMEDNLLKQAVDLVTGKTSLAELRKPNSGVIVRDPSEAPKLTAAERAAEEENQ
jgi:carboxyl-terminal processing protease